MFMFNWPGQIVFAGFGFSIHIKCGRVRYEDQTQHQRRKQISRWKRFVSASSVSKIVYLFVDLLFIYLFIRYLNWVIEIWDVLRCHIDTGVIMFKIHWIMLEVYNHYWRITCVFIGNVEV